MMAVAVLERQVERPKEATQKPTRSQRALTPSMPISPSAMRRCSCTRSTAFARKKDPMNTKCVSDM